MKNILNILNKLYWVIIAIIVVGLCLYILDFLTGFSQCLQYFNSPITDIPAKCLYWYTPTR